MTILEILNAASAEYPDEFLSEYYTATGEFNRHGSGDTLPEFIVRELIETYVEEDSDNGQIYEAIRVMERARKGLDNVINGLDRLRK